MIDRKIGAVSASILAILLIGSTGPAVAQPPRGPEGRTGDGGPAGAVAGRGPRLCG